MWNHISAFCALIVQHHHQWQTKERESSGCLVLPQPSLPPIKSPLGEASVTPPTTAEVAEVYLLYHTIQNKTCQCYTTAEVAELYLLYHTMQKEISQCYTTTEEAELYLLNHTIQNKTSQCYTTKHHGTS